jgi:uncharacterized membrane protein YtjA (UPF0391 family)
MADGEGFTSVTSAVFLIAKILGYLGGISATASGIDCEWYVCVYVE